MRSWFRIGLRVGVLAGVVAAVVLAARSRRGGAQDSLATGVHGEWPDVRRAGPSHEAGSTGDHHPHGRVTVPREAAPMGAPPAVDTRDRGPAEPEAPEPREHLDSEEAGSAAASTDAASTGAASTAVPAAPVASAKKAAPRKAAARKAPAGSAAAWVEPDGKACPPTHPVKAKLASRLYHLPGMLAYDRTIPDRCYVDPAAAEADGFSRAKR